MTRRTMTFAVAGALLIALVAVAALLPVPYVVYSPGPMADVLAEQDGEPVISVDGADTYDTDGVLNLTTVSVTSADTKMDLLTALRGWIDSNRAIVPRDLVYQDGVTGEERRERNAQLLERSQETAKVAALRRLGYEVPEAVVIESIFDDTPADGILEPGDIIETVDDVSVTSPDDVVEAVQSREPGETVDVVISRDGDERSLTLDTQEAEDGGHAMVGAGVASGYEFPIQIDVTIDERIGGPSAGMIFALGIYDTMTPGALLEGLSVAGTGEITGDGEVGAIGGIQQKIAAAAEDGADVFLAPASNCDDVVDAHNQDMPVVSIENLDDAIAAVEAVGAGETASLPSCQVS